MLKQPQTKWMNTKYLELVGGLFLDDFGGVCNWLLSMLLLLLCDAGTTAAGDWPGTSRETLLSPLSWLVGVELALVAGCLVWNSLVIMLGLIWGSILFMETYLKRFHSSNNCFSTEGKSSHSKMDSGYFKSGLTAENKSFKEELSI